MTREDLFAIAAKHGYKTGKALTAAKRKAVEAELRAYFNKPEGRQALEDAPRVAFVVMGEAKHRQRTADDAVRDLMEELT